jgi:catechol 2,3-dioxygenase-like lactoylglutathione lyase family enzyme
VPAALDHVTITAVDFGVGLAFYDTALRALGLIRLDEFGDEEEDGAAVAAAAWGPAAGPAVLWLVTGSTPTTGLHLRLRADSRRQVETFHDAGVASGGSSHAVPRRWTVYRRGEFNAIVRDPAGNLIEAVAAE